MSSDQIDQNCFEEHHENFRLIVERSTRTQISYTHKWEEAVDRYLKDMVQHILRYCPVNGTIDAKSSCCPLLGWRLTRY